MRANISYPIGSPGQCWGEPERAEWRARQKRHRSYDQDVVKRIDALGDRYVRIDYGKLSYGEDVYPLHAVRSHEIDPSLPTALITGGVHGYETSGVAGALDFLERHADDFAGKVNLLVVPCVSPWAYEHISRWNPETIDPNRSFRADGLAKESSALVELVRSVADGYLLHIDLHETTDSDETEFRPALSARDGESFEPGEVPDGFYLVADAADPQLGFQRAIIAAVAKITRIAPADSAGEIIGSPIIANGVIAYPMTELGLCGAISGARFVTTTEIYPDAPDSTAELSVEAQVTAICAALNFVLSPKERGEGGGPLS